MSRRKCKHSDYSIATCGKCGRSWCDECDPTPASLCHYCHGRGYSLAPRNTVVGGQYVARSNQPLVRVQS